MKQIKCIFCSGTGKNDNKKCEVCKGTGKIDNNVKIKEVKHLQEEY